MILTIDVGNTRIKGAVFESDTLVEQFQFEPKALQNGIESILNKYPSTSDLVVASVGNFDKNDFLSFSNQIAIYFISHTDPFPFLNAYATPNTLGIDRMVLAAGATLRYPNQNRLVIDAGTCITYDMINKEGIYYGGSISAGINMRLKAMHQFTSKLPLVPFDESFDKNFGQNSSEAILSGVLNGVWFEAKGFLEAQQTNNFKVILCGGDAPFFDTRFKNSIFAHLILHEPNLVLIGLNTVVKYQHDHN